MLNVLCSPCNCNCLRSVINVCLMAAQHVVESIKTGRTDLVPMSAPTLPAAAAGGTASEILKSRTGKEKGVDL